MRLWPLEILNQLPRQQLLGQHRECCALRGKGWGRKHSTVDYVFRHPYYWLWIYHLNIMEEMRRRGYYADRVWMNYQYRGKTIGLDESDFTSVVGDSGKIPVRIYPEHNERYLAECLANLASKGIIFKEKKTA